MIFLVAQLGARMHYAVPRILYRAGMLARDRELLAWMSANAIARSREFTLERYGERLVAAIRQAYANHQAALPAVAP